jgi:hypothetical protein
LKYSLRTPFSACATLGPYLIARLEKHNPEEANFVPADFKDLQTDVPDLDPRNSVG